MARYMKLFYVICHEYSMKNKKKMTWKRRLINIYDSPCSNASGIERSRTSPSVEFNPAQGSPNKTWRKNMSHNSAGTFKSWAMTRASCEHRSFSRQSFHSIPCLKTWGICTRRAGKLHNARYRLYRRHRLIAKIWKISAHFFCIFWFWNGAKVW